MSSDYYLHPRPSVSALFLIAFVVMCCVVIWADLLLLYLPLYLVFFIFMA